MDHIYSADYWLGFFSGIVGLLLTVFLAGFVQKLWERWRNRNKPKQDWDPIGYIEKVTETDQGIEVTGRLNEGFYGTDFLTKGAIQGLSIGMDGMPIRDRTSEPIVYLMPGEEMCMGTQTSVPGQLTPHSWCTLKGLNHGPHKVGRVIESAYDTSWVRETWLGKKGEY